MNGHQGIQGWARFAESNKRSLIQLEFDTVIYAAQSAAQMANNSEDCFAEMTLR